MPQTPHVEKHFTSGDFVRDMVIGISDGRTVPFPLAAGLSGAVPNTRLIVIGGLAEVAAGSIAMGLGGYLAARGDEEHYQKERLREQREVSKLHPALTVHDSFHRLAGLAIFSLRHAGGVGNLWVHQRPLHRHQPSSQLVTNHRDWRPGGGHAFLLAKLVS